MTDARPKTPLLDRIDLPADLKGLSVAELRQLADELRAETISAVSVTGGHLGAGLGVVELTVAIHAVFNAPKDKVIWDVGHQAYPHKILTGRRERIRTLRAGGGLSGFTRRDESPYDPFGAAHSSTSISAGLGFAVARDLGAPDIGDVVCVIGDGAMSAGMAYEAMNNAGHMKERLFVILNDNEMSISPPVGAMSKYLSRLYTGEPFQDLMAAAKGAVRLLPQPLQEGARRARELVKGMTVGGTLFEEMGFSYVGPIDGHDVEQLRQHPAGGEGARAGAGAGARADPEGQGLCAGGGFGRQVPRRGEIRRRDGRAAEEAVECAVLHEGLCAIANPRGRAGRADRGGDGGDAGRDGAAALRRAVPEAVLRRRHRGAACSDLLRRDGGGGNAAVLRDLFDVPAARLRPGGARRGDPAAAGALRHRPRRAGRGGRADACRELRRGLSRLPAGLRGDGGGGRGGAGAHGGDGGGDRRPAVELPLSARRRAWGSSCRSAACRWRSGAGGSCWKDRGLRSFPSARGWRIAWRRRRRWRRAASGRRWRMRASPSRSTGR